jgi:hypothetical protein
MRLVLPVMYYKGEAAYKIDNGISLDMTDFVVCNAVFYNIETIESIQGIIDQCIASNSGGEYRIALSMKELDKKIMQERKLMFYGEN